MQVIWLLMDHSQGRMADSTAPSGWVHNGNFYYSLLFHKLIQTTVEIKVLHLQNIDTIFTIIPISSVIK